MSRWVAASAFCVLSSVLLSCSDSTDKIDPADEAARRDLKMETPVCKDCGYLSGPHHACARTVWCESCKRDAGENHICVRTKYCEGCRIEVGEGHVCNETQICWNKLCRGQGNVLEKGANHIHGKSEYCRTCKREHMKARPNDTYPSHDCHAKTYACPHCEQEATQQHVCGKSRYCMECARPRGIDQHCEKHAEPKEGCPDCRFPHTCKVSYFCQRCGTEEPLSHYHEK